MWKDCLTVSGVIYCHYRQSRAVKGLLIRREHWKLESEQRKPWPWQRALEEGLSQESFNLQGDEFFPKCQQKALLSPGGVFGWPWLSFQQEKAISWKTVSELGPSCGNCFETEPHIVRDDLDLSRQLKMTLVYFLASAAIYDSYSFSFSHCVMPSVIMQYEHDSHGMWLLKNLELWDI